MVPAFQLDEIVRDARARTGVPGVAAGALLDGEVVTCADGVLELGRADPVRPETPFRVASISKPFTASLALSCLEPDPKLRAWLGHTAGWRCERAEPLPDGAEGLFSYSNAGYWAAGSACEAATGLAFSDAMRARILEPLGLAATGYDEPPAPARGHVQEGETAHRAVGVDAYPVARRPSGGLWSTVGDLLAFAAHQLGGPGPLSGEARAAMREPQSHALGAGYGLGWWVHDAGGRAALDHEGSVGGYQSLLLLVPEERFALAVLTNSWRGSGLVRRVVEALGLAAGPPEPGPPTWSGDLAGTYALDDAEARVDMSGGALSVQESETDPVTGARLAQPRLSARELGGGVFGYAGGALISHRLDFPRPGFGRIGWLVLPRVEP
ncbi:MAG TPA: serine hydrolase domain-containing protein [Gaiellaceae bacterium]|nr:serine hydrolase domain-containing protein [Gaiellaceae bacterium]